MKILITGASGMIGQALVKALRAEGHQVQGLSRTPKKGPFTSFTWDVEKGTIDPRALEGVEAIVNLAGAPIDERWTPQHKNAVLRSRVDGTRLLFEAVQDHKAPVKTLVSASAVGYYPNDYTRCFQEDDPSGNDFLSQVCERWEAEALQFEALGVRTVRMRIGIVLSLSGGALPKIAAPVKLGLGAPLGSGKQWMPWIHLDDVVGAMVHVLQHQECQGAYNLNAGNATNKAFTRSLAKVLAKPLFLPPVPAFALKLVLGDMSQTVQASNRVSNEKLRASGYHLRYNELEPCLAHLYSH